VLLLLAVLEKLGTFLAFELLVIENSFDQAVRLFIVCVLSTFWACRLILLLPTVGAVLAEQGLASSAHYHVGNYVVAEEADELLTDGG
jgi:hypothetical protein